MHRFEEWIRRKTEANFRYRWARYWVRQSGLLKQLGTLHDTDYRPAYYDLWLLYRTIRRQKPALVLEFGIGNSTIAIAKALKKNGSGRLVSIDASEHWVAQLKKRFPAELSDVVEVRYSPVEVILHNGERCHRFKDVPVSDPDFSYLDGPSPYDVPDWNGQEVLAADPLFYFSKPGSILMIDARFKNVAFLDRHLTGKYRKISEEIFKITTYQRISL